jgi:ssDNA-binding Zn-finger/Zn-ribbon topoisomerase 1
MAGTWSEFILDYLRLGFSDIVVIQYSHEEERRGYENEKTDETVVAKQNGKFVRLSVSLYQNFNPFRPARDVTLGSVMEISEEEYQRETDGKPVLETAAASEKLHAIKKLEETTPRCPNHNIPFVARTNSRTKMKFWGCPRYPNCQVTHQMSAEQSRWYMIATRI